MNTTEYARNVIQEKRFTVWPANDKTRDIPEPRVERFCQCGNCQRTRPEGAVGYLIVSGEEKGISLYAYTEDDYNALRAIYGGEK